ncbi:glycosyltransferase family 8 protein [Cadophora sp. DSE1049]|nr:glycosyltransferase family 8 protein [Cadophora sp. DSE1049]
MLFEILHRLGSKADRLMMYTASMHPDAASPTKESQLLLKAEREYNVKLMPIEVQHRGQGDLLSLDSDSTVLQHMDELFLLPPAPVAMPRAYWLDKPYLSSQLVLIQPSAEEFKLVKDSIDGAVSGDFDMAIVNNLYGKDCMIIPHRPYDLLTGEFRSQGKQETYLGKSFEQWDPEKVFKEAKFLHFSDCSVPKPWITTPESTRNDNQPNARLIQRGRRIAVREIFGLDSILIFRRGGRIYVDSHPSD